MLINNPNSSFLFRLTTDYRGTLVAGLFLDAIEGSNYHKVLQHNMDDESFNYDKGVEGTLTKNNVAFFGERRMLLEDLKCKVEYLKYP